MRSNPLKKYKKTEVALVLALLPLLAWLGLRFGMATPLVNYWLSGEPSARLGAVITVGSVRSNGWNMVEARNIQLLAGAADELSPVLVIERARLRFRMGNLLRGDFDSQ